MIRVRLVTAAGDFVAEVEMPGFTNLPHVVVWGERIFAYLKWTPDVRSFAVYAECFAWYAPPSRPIAA